MRSSRFVVLILLFGLLWVVTGMPPAAVSALPSAGVSLSALVNCPAGGCAAGQRLNFKADFSFSQLDASKNPNVQVCVFTPVNWSVLPPVQFAAQGQTSNQPYTYDISHCVDAAPSQYTLSGGASAKLLDAAVGDAITFGFRLGSTATTNGAIVARVYEQNASGAWVKVGGDVQSSVAVTAKSTSVFVANDASTCGANTPCYVNSSDDLPGGLGTGLKDAIDAASAPAIITLLGNVNLKQNTVIVNQPHLIKGTGSSRLTYSGSACDQPMLNITAGATISVLSIDDGSACSTTSRDLVLVNSSSPVTIESNDLVNGRQAITAGSSNSAALTVHYNHITGNSGYAILQNPANTGVLEAIGNNLFSNRAGAQVDCGGPAKGTVNHNYWGPGVLASGGASNCSFSDPKRLGAAILRNSNSPGVQVVKVPVGTTRQYAFSNSVGFQRSASGSDFELYIANHGSGSPANIPFTSGQAVSLQACSNYWDIFFASSTGPVNPTTFDLFFKYNLSSTCLSAVESAQYCGQTTSPSSYPLWWFDLASGNWLTTGSANGQPTTCQVDTDEIQVSIDAVDGKPSFNEMSMLPFVVGVPSQPVSVTFTNLAAQPGNNLAILTWMTSSEINMAGYYVQRSTSQNGTFGNVSALLPRKGTGTGGASYQFTNDSGLVNNTPYFYRILVVGYDGSSSVSGVVSVTPIPPTPTITWTPSITPIPATATRTPSLFPTSTFIFRTATRTATRTSTPTSPFRTITNTPSITPTSLTRTATPSPTTVTGSPIPTTAEASTELASTRQARTTEAMLLLTPTSTPEPTDNGTGTITVVMAVLAVGAVLGGAVYLIREQRVAH